VPIGDIRPIQSVSLLRNKCIGNAFDLTWLTVACIKLKEIREGKMPRVRVKGLR
jgi:hypothetical protein